MTHVLLAPGASGRGGPTGISRVISEKKKKAGPATVASFWTQSVSHTNALQQRHPSQEMARRRCRCKMNCEPHALIELKTAFVCKLRQRLTSALNEMK